MLLSDVGGVRLSNGAFLPCLRMVSADSVVSRGFDAVTRAA